MGCSSGFEQLCHKAREERQKGTGCDHNSEPAAGTVMLGQIADLLELVG